MMKLSDLQCILLSNASQRQDGALHPSPAGVDPRGGAKAIGALLRRGLAEQRPGNNAQPAIHITAAGLQAIGIEPDAGEEGPGKGDPVPAVAGSGRRTKGVLLLTLLQREEGAVMADLTEATGWLPHTVRAALTGLRKKGHAVDRGTRDGKSCYRVAVCR